MFQFIFYLTITIGILHFTLYYFNFDFDFNDLNYFKNTHTTLKLDDSNCNSDNKSENLKIFTQTASNIQLTLNDSVNELKTLNECINNGEINTTFS
jgi:hypothetical protein